jgi:hypothetical protein
MSKLIKLELQRINLRFYFITSCILAGIILTFIYFIANVAQITQERTFMTYDNIFQLTCIISLFTSSILSTVMYNHLIVKDFSYKQILPLSYLVFDSKILIIRVFLISLFIMISMIIHTIVPLIFFSMTESFIPIVSDIMTVNLLLSTFQSVLISSIFSNTIGIIIMGINTIKKSVIMTLISFFILYGIYGNIIIFVNISDSLIALLLIIGISLFVINSIIFILLNKINHTEEK